MATLAGWGLFPARGNLRLQPLTLAIGALVAVLLMQLPVVLNRAINWDEFYHYSVVQKFAHGTLALPLQTLFARVFVWVTELPGTAIDHIVVIRFLMFACELVTIAAIIGMAAHFADRTTGVLCALAYVSAGFVFRHGTSFRFDPPMAALLMSALYILLKRSLDFRAIALTGLLIGTAGMWSIKAVLYLPAFAGVLWLRWREHDFSRGYLARVCAVGLLSAGAFGSLYLLHSQGLATGAALEAEKTVNAAAEKMFSIGYQPYWPMVPIAAALAPVLTALVAFFPFALWRDSRPGAQRLALLGLYLPITTLLFYHNTAPYYYAYMLPPVCVACCVVMTRAMARYGGAAIAAVLLLNGAIMLALEPASPIDKQRALLRAANEIFEQPVAYFDSYAMLGDFPKENQFMTPWGTERYLAGATPSLREALAAKTVPLVIDDQGPFSPGLKNDEPNPSLLPGDQAALRSTYVHFWGPYWVAGKAVPADGVVHAEDFLVPGPYTVRDAPLIVDGRTYRDGDIVQLGRGTHRLAAERVSGRLIWGERLRPPAIQPPAPPYWEGF